MPVADDLPLGRKTDYPSRYDPGLLRSIPRADSRRASGIPEPPPFDGTDVWNAYELSWLDARGKPGAYVGELRFPAASPRIVESKSLKLYLYSLNQERCGSADAARDVIRRDLTAAVEAAVEVTLMPMARTADLRLHTLPGACIDGARLPATATATATTTAPPTATATTAKDVDPGLLLGSADADHLVDETLHSHLFQTRCPVTNQPDQASVLIHYLGPKIDRGKLLGYLVSYRAHRGFAESSVEQMFMDIRRCCEPTRLTVHARFNRRGGLDINPFRSDFEADVENLRLWRQ